MSVYETLAAALAVTLAVNFAEHLLPPTFLPVAGNLTGASASHAPVFFQWEVQ